MTVIKKLKYARDRKKYERQPDEPDTAWAVFVMYRDQGYTRTLREATRQHLENTGSKAKLLTAENNTQKWSQRWRWRERIVEWDRHIDRARRRGAEEDVIKMRARHAKEGENLQNLGVKALHKWLTLKTDEELKDVPITDIVRAIEAGVKIERTARDLPDSISEERVQVTEKTRDKMLGLLDEDKFGGAVDLLLDAANTAPGDHEVH